MTALRFYRLALSPIAGAMGARCRFHPTCSEYAHAALATLPVRRALALITRRILRCGPWSAGGIDEVPAS